MPLLGGIVLALDVVAIVHIVRMGYPRWWIYVVIFAPGVGALAFFLFEVLPGLGKTPAGQQVAARVRHSLDPDRRLRELGKAHDLAATPRTAMDLAAELSDRGRHDEARAVFGEVMTGLFEHDAALLIGRARVEFAAGEFAATRASLDLVQARHPGYASREGHLLYARAVEALGDTAQASEEYEALIPTYPGPEAKARYALMLERSGDAKRARVLFAEIERAHDGWRKSLVPEDREWFELAKRKLG